MFSWLTKRAGTADAAPPQIPAYGPGADIIAQRMARPANGVVKRAVAGPGRVRLVINCEALHSSPVVGEECAVLIVTRSGHVSALIAPDDLRFVDLAAQIGFTQIEEA